MKAAVLHEYGHAPVYGDFTDPVPADENQLLVAMKAASIKNLDKGRASGAHYSSHGTLPAVVGVDGVGELEDGTLVYAMGVTGMMAGKAIVDRRRMVGLPAGTDVAVAAALPNAVIGAALALLYRAGMQAGKTVLVNGATGVTGKAAIQIARHYGARHIIATGRNAESLKRAQELGADETISLQDADGQIMEMIKKLHEANHIDIVMDYLWGHPAELVLAALKGGGIHSFTKPVRFVTAGSMAGELLSLPSGTLRSSAIDICGSGLGSLPQDALAAFNDQILPQMLQLNLAGKLQIDIETAPLTDIEKVWQMKGEAGKRMVIMISE